MKEILLKVLGSAMGTGVLFVSFLALRGAWGFEVVVLWIGALIIMSLWMKK